MKQIITISRQYGSGGRQVGAMLAEALSIPLYDKRLFCKAAKVSDIDEDFFESIGETPSSIFAHAFDSAVTASYLPLHDRMFLAQVDVIRELAWQGPCIIVGRGGNHILREREDVLNVLVYADQQTRVERVVEEYGVAASEALKQMQVVDKKRATYLKTYTDQHFAQPENYHLCINSGVVGIENAVKIILATYRAL